MKIVVIFGLSLLSVSVITSPAWASVQYAVTDLGIPPGGIASSAIAINNSGEISGTFLDSSAVDHAMYWPNYASPSISLPALGSTSSLGGAINDSGVICGSYTNSTYTFGCVWTNPSHTPSSLVVPVGATYYNCNGINNSGQLVGAYQGANSILHACYWGGSSNIAIELSEFTGATRTFASAINASGKIVGGFQDSTAYQACTWASYSAIPTTLAILVGTMSSEAVGINSSGQIVGGFSYTGINLNGERACVWNGDSVTDLNNLISPTSGWTLTEANGINDSGWIVGQGKINGVAHAILLTPVPALPPAPALVIAGKKKVTTHRSNLVIHGTTTGVVTSVTYKIGTKTRTARGTTSWKFTARLKPGKNKILVSSHGPGGSSPSVKITISRS